MTPRPVPLELVDELHGIPAAMQALRRHNERTAPAWQAQVDELAAWMHERLPRGPEGFNPTEWAALPVWVRLQLLDTWARWWQGTAETCQHWPVPQRPQPVAAALWRPGLVSCIPCSSYLLRLTGEADATCDGCGRITRGPQVGDGIHPSGVTYGHLLLFWGACRDCRVPPAPPRRKHGKRKGKR